MTAPRLFLVAPQGATAETTLRCTEAAAKAGDVASIVIPAIVMSYVTAPLQNLGIAVLVDGDTSLAKACDGTHVGGSGQIAALRKSLPKNAIIGAYCGASRHAAMQAGEDGADYVALDQAADVSGEPLIRWWSALFEVPCVAFEPVSAQDLDILLPQNPDFIRPADEMWQSPEAAHRVINGLMQALNGT